MTKRTLIIGIVAALLLFGGLAFVLTQPAPATAGLDIYVAPDGDDDNAGDKASPLATLTGARDRIRSIKASDGLPPGGVTVWFRGGEYVMTDSVYFTEEDSGTKDAPITYAAYRGETPVFTGGVYFNDSDLDKASGALAARLPAGVRSNVYAINLFENGFTAEDLKYNMDNDDAQGGLTFAVYAGDTALYPARYPNKVPGLFAENPYNEYIYIEDGGKWIDGRHQDRVKHPVFQIPPALASRMNTWASTDEVWLSGMLTDTWLHEKNLIHKYNPASRTIELNRNAAWFDRAPNIGKYYFENVLEELDVPGEYYIDKSTGMLFFYPPEGVVMKDIRLKIPLMKATMIVTRSASWLTFSDLTVELGRGSAFSIEGGRHVTVDGCTVQNMSRMGFEIGDNTFEGWVLAEYYERYGTFPSDEPSAETNGFHHTVKNCMIRNMGMSGAKIASGKVSTRESGYALFENNFVIHTGLIDNWGGVDANGVGMKVMHNTVKFAPALGIVINGPDSEAAYNEICDVISDPGQNDSSALGIHHGQLAWGLRVHDNYIHDIQQTPVRGWEVWGHEPTVPNRLALYVDATGAGCEVYRNVVYNVPQGMSIPDSPEAPSTYANNLFIDVMIPIQACQLVYIENFEGADAGEILGPPVPVGFFFTSGVYKTAWKDVYPEFYEYFEYYLNEKEDLSQSMSSIYNNICININTQHVFFDYPQHPWSPLPPKERITPDPIYGRYENNRYLDRDPGFVNYAGGNIQLTKKAAADLGIEWVDLSKIGARKVR
jgi:hypothetical protein